ncbi:F1/F0 ATPase, Methanosarcina type, subunit 2 [Marinibacterium anthonyi]|nr:F1/F0 ATPase, Methanosarcina type, subunit 2 [Marinibacterium anthonyi]
MTPYLPDAIGFAIGLALGLVLGLVHFASLKRVTALYLEEGSPARAIGLQLLRLGVLAVVMVLLAQQGAAPLLGGALGVVVARQVVIRRTRKEG